MKKLGFNKKASSGSPAEEDGGRSALFGSRKAKASSPSVNPYAQSSGNPYAQNDAPGGGGYGGLGGPPPAYDGGGASDRQRQEKSPVPAGGYGGGRYGNSGGGGYGGQGGYGGDRYGGGGGYGDRSSGSRGAGGYGGLGGANSSETAGPDPGRDALFGNAAERYQQQKPTGLPSGPKPGGYGESGGAYGEGGSGYGAYEDRQLTAEEEEEEDVTAVKQQVRQMKQEDVSSTRNALRLAAQAEQSGTDTLQRLGAQGERIHNTERHLDLASNQNRTASDKARELKTLNKSMFAMHVGNPFTASKRRDARDQAIIENHARERDQRESTRAAAFESRARQAEYQKGLDGRPVQAGAGAKNLAERSKYQFEADSEDEEMENEIDSNLDMLHGAAGRLGHLAKAMGDEVETQNTHIDRITGKTDQADIDIAVNRAKLDRIR